MAFDPVGFAVRRWGRTASGERLAGPTLALVVSVLTALAAGCAGLRRSVPPPATTPATGSSAEAARLEITVRGPGYLPPRGGPGEVVTSSRADSQAGPAIFRPGPAELTLTFSQPADRQAVEAALRAQLSPAGLAERVRLRRFSWDEAGKKLTVAMDQAAGQHGIFTGLQQPHLNLGELRDARGLPVDPQGAELRWVVARPVPVYRSAGLPAGTEAAGQVAALYDLRPAGHGALRGSRLLTWHRAGDEPECGTVQLLLWDLPAGTAVPLGPHKSGCGAWAAWGPGGDVIVAGVNGITRYAVGRDEVLPEPGRLTPETLYRVPEGRVVVGMAVAPDGKVAVFEASPPRAPGGAAGAVDLVLVDRQGRVDRRLAGVSDLTASESVWRTIRADWSGDGRALAFTRYRLGGRPGPDGNGPAAVTAALSLWRPGAARADELDVPAEAVSWRPGTGQVLVRSAGGWRLYDAESRAPVPVPVKLPASGHTAEWSADGRYAAWLGGLDGSGVLDLQTGARKQGKGLLPLGWNPADGKLYWIADPPA